jgi:AraC-like DNA-binding protein
MSMRTEMLRERIATLQAELEELEQAERDQGLAELRAAQREYLSASQDRKRAAAEALYQRNYTVAALAQASGLSPRGLYLLADRADSEPYEFATDELVELRHLAARYTEAERRRIDTVLHLRSLPEADRPSLDEMSEVMGITREGVRQIVKVHGRKAS